ncbi:MAG: RluA family pseudouridine synthase [Oscillospiraceae bacterium]|nr:RluA family pseudouridine synthase [Oscillospiraceae bacterium]
MRKNAELTVKSQTPLLTFLLDNFRGESRNYVKGLLKRGQVSVDGKVCTSHSQSLESGQSVKISFGKVNTCKLPILYEDGDIIVIDKPAGLLSVDTDKRGENTAYRTVNDYLQPSRVFIVHRLDRDTSGVMLFAKSERVKRILQDNWSDMTIRRSYTALVEGEADFTQKQIKSWLKQTGSLSVYSSQKEGDGKLAITNCRVIKISHGYSLLDVSLETGRKNQIRVHMKDIGHPVAGDRKYGAKSNPHGRLGLHASALTIKHPTTQEVIYFKSPLPHCFKTDCNSR